MFRSISVLLAFLFSVVASWAETPEQAASSYFEKMKTGGLGSVAGLMHPDELAKFRSMLTPVVEGALASERDRKTFEKFADPKEPGKMRAFDDLQFMTAFMEWVSALQPGLADVMKGATIDTLGHVKEKDLSHVVVRMRMKKDIIEIEKLSVLSFKDYKGTPMMMLTGEMTGMAEALKRQR